MKVIELFTVLKFTTHVEVFTEDNETLAMGKLKSVFDKIKLSNPPKWLNYTVNCIDFVNDVAEIRVRRGFDD